MPDKKEGSNLDNDMPDNDISGAPELPKNVNNSENKNSSTRRSIPVKSASAQESNKSSKKDQEDTTTDQAVDDIVRSEGDEVLAAEDAELNKAFVPDKKKWYKKLFAKKKIWIPLSILVVLILLFAIPFTRYKILGLVWKQNMSIVVLDSQTHRPVSSADVTLRGDSGVTNSNGKLVLRVPVGSATLTVEKHYYKSTHLNLTVPLHNPHTVTVTLKATGRQVPVKVIDVVSHQPVSNATVTADKTSVKTNKNGTGIIVLPANVKTVSGTVTAPSDYNKANITITVTTQSTAANDFKLVPSGRVYFLSNASGKIDVVSTELDGSDRQTVLAGTGSESSINTKLLHSNDWKYLALIAIRTASQGDNGTLYAINTATNQLSTVQSGVQNYIDVIGWSSDDHLIYTVSSTGANNWQSGNELLKSYNPATGKSITLDQTNAEGTSNSDYAGEIFNDEYILPNNTVLYSVYWTSSYPLTTVSPTGKQYGVYIINANGSNKQTIKAVQTDFSGYFSIIENKPNDYYIAQENISVPTYYEYLNGSLRVAPSNVNAQTFNNYYNSAPPTYYLSPDGNSTAWSIIQDGQAVVQRGDSSANNAKSIATLGGSYGAYGWYGSKYVLVEKSNSELFIIPASGLSGNLQPVKITDYFSPTGGR